MGYRSDVKALFYTGDKSKFPMLKLWVDENLEIAKEADSVQLFENTSYKGILISCDGWKWYDGYEQINNFNDAVGLYHEVFNTEDSDTDFHYEFVRIGEEHNDIERDGSTYCDYMLAVHREIVPDGEISDIQR